MIYYVTKLAKLSEYWVKPQRATLVAGQKRPFQALAKHGAVVPAHLVAYNQNSCKKHI